MIEKGEIRANVVSCDMPSPLMMRRKSRSKSRLVKKENIGVSLLEQSTEHSKYVLTPVSSSGIKLVNLSTSSAQHNTTSNI